MIHIETSAVTAAAFRNRRRRWSGGDSRIIVTSTRVDPDACERTAVVKRASLVGACDGSADPRQRTRKLRAFSSLAELARHELCRIKLMRATSGDLGGAGRWRNGGHAPATDR